MHKFKDANGEEWSIQLDTTKTREIRTALGVDLLSLDETSVTNLIASDETLVDVISLVCTEQIKQRDMDGKKFAACLIGDALDGACDALLNEVVFISRRNRSQIVAKAWEKTKAAEQRLTNKAMEYLDSGKIDEILNREVEKLETTLGNL